MRWTAEQASQWYNEKPWLCGFNYLPSTAVNSTEMWQAETFDPATIDRELGWAEGIGLNSCRVFLQYLVWEHDPDGLAARLGQFLEIAGRHGLSVMPILFDDCAFAGKQPYLGRQDDPTPGVHNSGWTPSPGRDRAADQKFWPHFERYVTDLLTRFGADSRILLWDIYNEPGNEGLGNQSLPLLRAAFGWARAAVPFQPLTAAVWNPELLDLNAFSTEASDVLSFHNYDPLPALETQIAELQASGRPVLCTEWMRRTDGLSLFETHLGTFRRAHVGCYFWGLVNGRTQTHFPWGSPVGAPPPQIWFHDLLDSQGKPYREDEVAGIRAEIAQARP